MANDYDNLILLDNVSLTNLGSYMLFDEIHEDSAHKLCDYLLKANLVLSGQDTLTLFVNSPGGSVTDGWAIIDVMEASHVDIQTVAIGSIASMGVLIFTAGTKGKRIMTPRTEVMAHQFSAGLWGKAHELIAARKFHDRLDQQFVEHFIRHTKMDEATIRKELMGPSDRWLTPEECLEFGICDQIRDPWVHRDEIQEAADKVKKSRKKRTKKDEASDLAQDE